MPRQRKSPVEGLTFLVTTTDPNDATAAANKKRVRSIAAQKSWSGRLQRMRKDDDTNEAEYCSDAHSVSAGVKPMQHLKRKRSHESDTTTLERQPCVESSSHCQTNLNANKRLVRTKDADFDSIGAPPIPSVDIKCNQPKCPRQIASAAVSSTGEHARDAFIRAQANSVSTALLTPPNTPDALRPIALEPYNCAPVPHEAWYDQILHHMMTVFAPRGWPALKITQHEGIKWERFMMQHALADPALYYVRLLFASGDLVQLGTLDRQKTLWLQNKAIESINEALRDPKRATSDALILAVGRIALHECMYGDRDAANALHRPAQQRMIQLRGGMRSLEFPEMITRLMRWSDEIMSIQGGTARMLEDDTDNPNYTLSQSIEVLEEWVPTQGSSLRNKISIADLMNKSDAT